MLAVHCSHMAHEYDQVLAEEWVTFHGGELEGKRPKALCPACRQELKSAAVGVGLARRRGEGGAPRGTEKKLLCFQCYRADLDRQRAMAAAGELDTASEVRFQFQLPLEPVNTARLDLLKADRAEARAAMQHGIGAFVDKRRQAQIAARHALQTITAGLEARQLPVSAIHAAELQLPDAWLPFVVSR
jgi:hypothetical protein